MSSNSLSWETTLHTSNFNQASTAKVISVYPSAPEKILPVASHSIWAHKSSRKRCSYPSLEIIVRNYLCRGVWFNENHGYLRPFGIDSSKSQCTSIAQRPTELLAPSSNRFSDGCRQTDCNRFRTCQTVLWTVAPWQRLAIFGSKWSEPVLLIKIWQLILLLSKFNEVKIWMDTSTYWTEYRQF